MEFGQLSALPRQSLVLLASARHLVTTGSKARLAERIHAFEHAIPPPAGSTDAVGTNNVTPPPLTVTVNEDPSTANAFSEVQITQLRSLISAAVHSERVGSQHHPVPVQGSLLSPVTPQLQSPSRTIQTGLQNTQINPTPNNNYSAGAEQHGVGPSLTLGPNPPPANLIGTPGTSASTHNLPPLPEKFYSRSPNCSPLGVVPKKDGSWRIIMDLSSPRGSYINDFISKEDFTLQYASFDQALALVSSFGTGALMVKLDLKHAFRLCPVFPSDVTYLACIGRENSMWIFAYLSVYRSSPFLFNRLADAFEWILKNNYAIQALMHYLDDYFTRRSTIVTSMCISSPYHG